MLLIIVIGMSISYPLYFIHSIFGNVFGDVGREALLESANITGTKVGKYLRVASYMIHVIIYCIAKNFRWTKIFQAQVPLYYRNKIFTDVVKVIYVIISTGQKMLKISPTRLGGELPKNISWRNFLPYLLPVFILLLLV